MDSLFEEPGLRPDSYLPTMNRTLILGIIIVLSSCRAKTPSESESTSKFEPEGVYLTVLGTLQDAGAPHIACKKECCTELFENPDPNRMVVSLGLVDNRAGKKYLFEATPDMSRQMKALVRPDVVNPGEFVDGIFLTHAHIGHYTGLMYLGKEATNANRVPVYAMPRMQEYLETNGPWSRLVSMNNIALMHLIHEQPVELTPQVAITPILVPHRDEYSETVGYRIEGPGKSALFIPDIDKWSKWERDIIEEIKRVDYAFLDATFYSGEEINTRDISQIPHPFIIESMELFKDLPAEQKAKVVFIHFNHTNPVVDRDSPEAQEVLKAGFGFARVGEVYEL